MPLTRRLQGASGRRKASAPANEHQPLDERRDVVEQLEAGMQPRAQTLERDQRLEQQAELHERRPERLEREAGALGQRPPRELVIGRPAERLVRLVEQPVDADRFHQVVQPEMKQRARDPGEPRQRPQPLDRGEQHHGTRAAAAGQPGGFVGWRRMRPI